MNNIMDKDIRENDAIATIEFKYGTSDKIINEIDNIISTHYDQFCEFIIKINKNKYKGDMACLSAYSSKIYKELENEDLWKYIIKFDLYNSETDEYEDVIEGVNECYKS